jgi:hypothetical protein
MPIFMGFSKTMTMVYCNNLTGNSKISTTVRFYDGCQENAPGEHIGNFCANRYSRFFPAAAQVAPLCGVNAAFSPQVDIQRFIVCGPPPRPIWRRVTMARCLDSSPNEWNDYV